MAASDAARTSAAATAAGPALAPFGTKVLFRTAGFGLARHRCRHGEAHPHPHEEVVPRPEVVFVRSGAFVHSCGRGRATVDAHQVLLLNAWEPYRVSHPAGADDCFVVRLPEEDLHAAAGGRGESPAQPFQRLTGTITTGVALELHRLAALAVSTGGSAEPLALQERLLAVVAASLREAGAVPAAMPAGRRASTRRDHADRVEAVKQVLSQRLGERVDLAGLGRAVHVSPFHLARLFRAATGTSIHRYLVGLRLRHALARIADGERDLAGLAHELGFADHAHMTGAFRRELGATPSVLRRALRSRAA